MNRQLNLGGIWKYSSVVLLIILLPGIWYSAVNPHRNNCTEFDFNKLDEKDVQHWYRKPGLKKTDSIFFKNHLEQFQEFRTYTPEYRTCFRLCDITFDSSIGGYVICEHITDNIESNMYLIYSNRFGKLRILRLAKLNASPDDSEEISSHLEGNTILSKRIYRSYGAKYISKDSILSVYSFVNDRFVRVKYDSFRVVSLIEHLK
jgi:hypothetical protein